MPDAQRYTVTVTYEVSARDGSGPNGTWTRTVTLWALSPTKAKAQAEGWAKREFGGDGRNVVTAHATDAQLTP